MFNNNKTAQNWDKSYISKLDLGQVLFWSYNFKDYYILKSF